MRQKLIKAVGHVEAKERRKQIKERLGKSDCPVTGAMLSKELGVSRQVIVGDIAILRASGLDIYATPDGYVMPPKKTETLEMATFACRHGRAELAEELEIIIDHGGKVLDVIVEHPVYGELKANLMLSSRHQLADFLNKLASCGAEPLSIVTGGVHLHTVTAPSRDILERIGQELRNKGIAIND
jgi:transcriptional regulator of NAD metabolism